MKRGWIKDKNLFLKILDKININFLDLILDNGGSSFVNILELTFPNINDRIEIFQKFYQKFLEVQEYQYLLTFVVGDKRSKDYIKAEDEKLILNKNRLYYPIYTVDEVLEKIIAVNPKLLEKYPGLQREYEQDGTKKVDIKPDLQNF